MPQLEQAMPTFQSIPLQWQNRQSCYVCKENLANRPFIAGRDGNRCIGCYCRNSKIDEAHFQSATTSRNCYECIAHDLTFAPAIIEIKNGVFLGLVCFRHKFWRDSQHDEPIKIEFEAGKKLYEKECSERLKRYERQCAEWESRYGVQWRKRRASFWGNIFDSWLPTIPMPPQKEPLPPLYAPSRKRALCGYPELMFSVFEEADFNPCIVQLEFEPVDSSPDSDGFYYGYPLDWDDRRKKCRERDDFCCCACGVKEQKEKQHHVHHVIPIAKGGNHSLQNLVTLCEGCHVRQEYYDHKSLLEKARAKKK